MLKDGKIVARGHHSKIIHTSPDYRRIFGKHADLPPLIVEKESKVQPVHTVGGS